MKLVTVSQMIAIEKQANANGLAYAEMMHNAGVGLAKIVHEIGRENNWHTVTGLVGAGNNGGDTLIALTQLAEQGWWTRAYLLKRNLEDEAARKYLELGGEIKQFPDFDSLRIMLNESNVLLDGLLGTGIMLPLRREAAQILAQTNQIISEMNPPPFVVAVDCPSGVNCDTGETAAETIPADLTITMAAVKRGLLKLPAFEMLGELQLAEIGLPDDALAEIKIDVADDDLVAGLLPERPPAAHKGTFGTAFVVAGSTAYTGAALLASEAAYRVGAGLVTLAAPAPLHSALASQLPEATWILLPHENGFISDQAASALQNIERATSFLIGPGLGNHLCTQMFVEDVLPFVKVPLVIDADGLRHLAQIKDWHKKISNAVLTPHLGEMSALTGLPKEEIQANREEVAQKFAKAWNQAVVLKGAFTVIAAPDGRMTVIPVATPALAKAGTGDVLAGLVTGLLAQGLSPYDAAVAGAYIHGKAGLLAADKFGTSASVLASDVLGAISDVLANLE